MKELTITVPSEYIFDIIEMNLQKEAKKFNKRPSQLLIAILRGRIIPRQHQNTCLISTKCGPVTVSFDVEDHLYQETLHALAAWNSAHPENNFGDFVLNLGLGNYELIQAPPKRQPKKIAHHSQPRCRICGHPLKTPAAIAKGIGPTCDKRTRRLKQAA